MKINFKKNALNIPKKQGVTIAVIVVVSLLLGTWQLKRMPID